MALDVVDRRTLCLSAIGLASSVLGGREVFAAPNEGDAVYLGLWGGVHAVAGPHLRSESAVILRIDQSSDGGLQISDEDPRMYGYPPAPLKLTPEGDLLASASSIFGQVDYRIRFNPANRTIEATITRPAMEEAGSGAMALRKDAPDLRRWRAPRVNTYGRVLDYAYARPAPGSGWTTASLEDERLDRTKIEDMVRTILQQQADPLTNRTDSVVIVRHGKLVLEEYFWGYARGTPHAISSDTKSVTSMAAGIAIDTGAIRATDRVIDYFPDYGDTVWLKERSQITIGDLMSMQANVVWNEDVPYQDPRNTAIGLAVAEDPIRYVLNTQPAGAPGAKFQYNSGLPNIVGDIVSRTMKQPFDALVQSRLFAPLGINNWRWARQKNGHVLAAGGLAMPPLDMAKLGQTMLDRGAWKGSQILSPQWVAESTRQHTAPSDYPYGYYWHLSTSAMPRLPGFDAFMAIGQAGQFIIVIPKEALVIVVTSSNWQPGGTPHALKDLITSKILPAVRRAG